MYIRFIASLSEQHSTDDVKVCSSPQVNRVNCCQVLFYKNKRHISNDNVVPFDVAFGFQFWLGVLCPLNLGFQDPASLTTLFKWIHFCLLPLTSVFVSLLGSEVTQLMFHWKKTGFHFCFLKQSAALNWFSPLLCHKKCISANQRLFLRWVWLGLSHT